MRRGCKINGNAGRAVGWMCCGYVGNVFRALTALTLFLRLILGYMRSSRCWIILGPPGYQCACLSMLRPDANKCDFPGLKQESRRRWRLRRRWARTRMLRICLVETEGRVSRVVATAVGLMCSLVCAKCEQGTDGDMYKRNGKTRRRQNLCSSIECNFSRGSCWG